MLTKIRSKLAAMIQPKPRQVGINDFLRRMGQASEKIRQQAIEEAQQLGSSAVVIGPDGSIQHIPREWLNEPSALPSTPPAEPEPVYPPEQRFTWETWAAMAREANVPGWSFCRMPMRDMTDDQTIFWLGVVKGEYGVFTITTPVCVLHSDGFIPYDPEVLANLVHLPSGVSLACFRDRALACRAADLAPELPPLHSITHEEWANDYRARFHGAWEFHGIVKAPTMHAHPNNMPIKVPVFTEAEIQKPEKLS